MTNRPPAEDELGGVLGIPADNRDHVDGFTGHLTETGLDEHLADVVLIAERDVGDLLRRRRAVRPFQHRLGQIDPDGVPLSRPMRGHPGDLAGAAADVEDTVVPIDRGCLEERRVEPGDQSVVALVDDVHVLDGADPSCQTQHKPLFPD
jgi:hypothetical protein